MCLRLHYYKRASAVFLAVVLLMGCANAATETPPIETQPPTEELIPSTDEPQPTAAEEIAPTESATAEPAEAPTQISNAIVVEDQQAPPDRLEVVVKSVTVDQPAWVVVGIDLGGNPGPALDFAWVRVEAGTTANVAIPLLQPPPFPAQIADSRWKLWIQLFADQGAEGDFEFPGPDVPLTDANGNVAAASFEFTLPPPP